MKKLFNATSIKIECHGATTVYTGFVETEHEGSLIDVCPKRLNEFFNQLGIPDEKRAYMGFGCEFFFEATHEEKRRYKVKSEEEFRKKTLTLTNKGKKRPKGQKPFVLMVVNESLGKDIRIVIPAVKGNRLLGRKPKVGTSFNL